MKGSKKNKQITYNKMKENSNLEKDNKSKKQTLKLPQLYYNNYITENLEESNIITKKRIS